MQQTLPWVHEPLGRPEIEEQADADEHIPASSLGDVQASILLRRLDNGVNGVNKLLSRPMLNRLAPKLPKPKRPSWLS
jgi:hypothetical protein